MKPREQAIKDLEAAGFIFRRHGARHDIFFNSSIGCMISLKRHDFDESDLRYIRNEIKKSQKA